MLLVILVAGLHPKNLDLMGTITKDGRGLTGNGQTIAKTSKVLNKEILGKMSRYGFKLTLSLTVPKKTLNTFATITSITDGASNTQLLIGQWKNQIIVMRGDDYPDLEKSPRLYINTDSIDNPAEPFILSVTFSENGASAAVNGVPGPVNELFDTDFSQHKTSWIIFSNQPTRKHGWLGSIQNFSLQILPNLNGKPGDFLDIDLQSQPVSIESNISNFKLYFPPNYQLSNPVVFGAPPQYFNTGWLALTDMIINTLGFVPFGFLLYGSSKKRTTGYTRRHVVVIYTVFWGFSLSFVIELLQSVILTRDSSIFDLAFNTLGTLLGALLAYWIFLPKNRKSKRALLS